jgi:hypothetical protein
VVAHSTGAHSTSAKHGYGGLSLGYLIVAAVLIGFGLFSAVYFLFTFQWVWLAAIGTLVIGSVMLFSRRAGDDHAETPAPH